MPLLGVYLAGCLLLVAAGVGKVASPNDTALALSRSLNRAGWINTRTVRAAAALEGLIGLAALLWPVRPLAATVAASYVGFGAFLLYARSTGGSLSTCGCFGQPDTPATRLHVGLDALFLTAAVWVAVSGPDRPMPEALSHQYGAGVPLVAATILAAWIAYLGMVPLARLQALRAMPAGDGLGSQA